MRAHDAAERTLVGQRQCRIAQGLRACDQFFRVRGAGEKAEVANGSSTITVSGSQNYSITINGSTDYNLDSLFPGNYTYLVTDLDNGCTANGSFNIGIKDSLRLSVNPNQILVCECIDCASTLGTGSYHTIYSSHSLFY